MDVRFVNFTIAALVNILPQLGFKNVVRGKVFARAQFIDSLGVAINAGITSQPTGSIVFNMTEESAKKLSSVMLNGTAVESLDDLAQSTICEMVNMVTANAANSINQSGIQFQLAPPAFSQGDLKMRVCNGNYLGFEMIVDELMLEVGIGLN